MPKTWMNYGVALIELGRTFEGIDAYKTALEVNPAYPEALNNIGAVYYGMKRYEDAKEYWERCLKVDPRFQLALDNLKLIKDA